MDLQSLLKKAEQNGEKIETPAYYFDSEEFEKRVKKVKDALGCQIPLTYSIKANPFLLKCLPEEIMHVEVCSPGELEICKNLQIQPEKIIYSGVMKEKTDIHEAIHYGASILTAESIQHVELENEAATQQAKQKVILRLTSGNQFGMSKEDICYLISNQQKYPNLEFYGIHYYSGTQKKKKRNLEKDLTALDNFLQELEQKYDYHPQLVEYGPGLAVDYFEEPYEQKDEELLSEVSDLLIDFSQKYPLGIEMGRFLAASCGTYLTQVKDIKESYDTNYIICDGGMHHLKYYGQTMAMQVPPIWVKKEKTTQKEQTKIYCVCGSLCTVADVLVREVEFPELAVGDILGFERCGAYSVTEGSSLFLSRMMPRIYLVSKEGELVLLRDFVPSDEINTARSNKKDVVEN